MAFVYEKQKSVDLRHNRLYARPQRYRPAFPSVISKHGVVVTANM
jgi:hypothetical protein